MKNTAHKIFLILFLVCFSALASATCLPIQGTIQTQSLNDQTEQVGTITMTSTPGNGNLLAFQKAFGQILIMGGIKGTITTPTNTYGQTTLEHQIGFPGVGSIISYSDVAQITGAPDAAGNYPVTETASINAIPDGGAFAGWNGQLVATGTLGTQTGTNAFTYTGKICK
jgi:hypothetical protein